MTEFLHFFEFMPIWQKLLWIFLCLNLNWILEALIPFVKFDYKKLKHIGVNLVFLSTSMLINLLFGLATVGVFVWLGQAEFGILYLFELPVWAELLLAILVLDLLAQYLSHYLLHKLKWMWKFHLVHHSDSHVDATTGTRHHPGDYLIREIFSLGAIIIMGMPLAFYLFYRIVTIFFAYFTHANINLPPALDKSLSLIIVSPAMHKFHHHHERPWTDSNFGNIFSFWDRIFGTFVYGDPAKVKYGLDILDSEKDENIGYQFKLPFNKDIQTDY